MASNKLQNIKAVKELLAGEHRTQTRKSFYYNDVDKNREAAKIRNVGDRWIVEQPNGQKIYYEQMEGYRRQSNTSWEKQELFDKLREESRKFKNCLKDKCTCLVPSQADLKLKWKTGMCLECVTTHETRLRMRGEFVPYAKNKMLENVKSYIRDMTIELEKWKEDIRSKMSFANGDSTIEQWSVENPEILIDKMQKEFDDMCENLLKNYGASKNEEE